MEGAAISSVAEESAPGSEAVSGNQPIWPEIPHGLEVELTTDIYGTVGRKENGHESGFEWHRNGVPYVIRGLREKNILIHRPMNHAPELRDMAAATECMVIRGKVIPPEAEVQIIEIAQPHLSRGAKLRGILRNLINLNSVPTKH